MGAYSRGVLIRRLGLNRGFTVINTENDALLFFEFLNAQHPNIKFTIEKKTNRILEFLDVCIDNNDPPCLTLQSFVKRLLPDCLLTSSVLLYFFLQSWAYPYSSG